MKDDSEIFDFGFTAVSEDELEAVQNLKKDSENVESELRDSRDKLYRAIKPLLENLKKNPERDYIYWPDRVAKVEAFERHIEQIVMQGQQYHQ